MNPIASVTCCHFFKDVSKASNQVIIAGAGPAGLFAALKLIEQGIRPIIIERGKEVRARRRDLAMLNKEGEVNPESNYCFGEGGKLETRRREQNLESLCVFRCGRKNIVRISSAYWHQQTAADNYCHAKKDHRVRGYRSFRL
jgi:uncharacterized FAD-dependent dehydrogenase